MLNNRDWGGCFVRGDSPPDKGSVACAGLKNMRILGTPMILCVSICLELIPNSKLNREGAKDAKFLTVSGSRSEKNRPIDPVKRDFGDVQGNFKDAPHIYSF